MECVIHRPYVKYWSIFPDNDTQYTTFP